MNSTLQVPPPFGVPPSITACPVCPILNDLSCVRFDFRDKVLVSVLSGLTFGIMSTILIVKIIKKKYILKKITDFRLSAIPEIQELNQV